MMRVASILPTRPLFLARGTVSLLKASLQSSRSTGTGAGEHSDRSETLKQASKSFDDALRASNNMNIMALMGKAKVLFSSGNFRGALSSYQTALEHAPDMLDPDPRIGIGCCLWQMGHKDHARMAWQRSLDLNEDSKIANILLGLCHLDESHQYVTQSEEWKPIYMKAMTTHTQTAFKLDGMHALTCSTFGSYFLLRKTWANVERLARRAIEHTDVNAIASDGWYLLARKHHHEGDMAKAADTYSKADQARGGEEKGYLPAKFGQAQIKTYSQDYDSAKFRLEKLIEKSKSTEAMTLLGVLHAEDVFAAQASGSKEDKGAEAKKAIAMLEQVRIAWKDPKRKIQPDQTVLLNLARLYENEAPEKALACLVQVEQMEMAAIPDEDIPDEIEDEEGLRRAKREMLNPQLLNNIGCFHFQAEKFAEAREAFQTALSACVKLGDRKEKGDEEDVDTDALVSTISYNLARTYEAENIDDEARKIYSGLLERHPDYIDANVRLAYLSLKIDPQGEGADAIKQLMESDPSNLEIRSLYGWYTNRAKKRTLALNEDREQRHYKQTLQSYDKHDLYALTGMGNLHLVVAREMPRDTDQHRERRSKMYLRAVEFFDKVLTLDPKNAYAAQGMGIAVVEDKRDTSTAIQIFTKVRESVKDAPSVHINLGHVFAEVRQYSRAVENYEIALAKSRVKAGTAGGAEEHQILAYLGRVWLMRGRQEKKLEAYKTSLDFSREALVLSPESVNARFNVAFVQIQLAQMIGQIKESEKTLEDVEAAAIGLDEAIEEFSLIAKLPNPPFPKQDIEQRASMGRNTMKRQLAAAVERQGEYESANRERLEEARRKREEVIEAREREKAEMEAAAEDERRKIKEERKRMAEEDRVLIERRMEEDRAKEAEMWTTDEETGERRKREKKPKEKRAKRKKKGDEDTDGEIDGVTDGEGKRSRPRSGVTSTAASEGEGGRRKKKRKLETRKGKATTSSKYKSKDIVEDSSDDENGAATQAPPAANEDDEEADGARSSALPETPGAASTPGGGLGEEGMPEDEEGEEPAVSRVVQRKKVARILDDDEDEDESGGDAGGVAEAGDSDHGGDGLRTT